MKPFSFFPFCVFFTSSLFYRLLVFTASLFNRLLVLHLFSSSFFNPPKNAGKPIQFSFVALSNIWCRCIWLPIGGFLVWIYSALFLSKYLYPKYIPFSFLSFASSFTPPANVFLWNRYLYLTFLSRKLTVAPTKFYRFTAVNTVY